MSGLTCLYAGNVGRLLRMVGMVFLAIACISACTSTSPTSVLKKDIITDSDETDGRKRAKIRLELAMGYFSNGQTTIALDELKQSIAADNTLFEAHNLRGLIYLRLNDLGFAEESFLRALSLNPSAASVQHNYGWMLCQQNRMQEATRQFMAAIDNPLYADRAKTWLAQAVCQLRVGQRAQAEASFLKSHELDPANPIASYNLALLMYERKDFVRAQYYVRRINNGDFANAETLWLGIKIERSLGNADGQAQLMLQLKRRFPQSKEAAALERGAFDE
jgi:type IV pilus assembly protein PilF